MPRLPDPSPQLAVFRHVFLRPPEEDQTDAQRGVRLKALDRPEWFHEQMARLEKDYEAKSDRRKKMDEDRRVEAWRRLEEREARKKLEAAAAAAVVVKAEVMAEAVEKEDEGSARALALIERLLAEAALKKP